jgi:O-antigen ligase
MPLLFLRFYLMIVVLAIVGAVIVGVLLKDKRWFRFAWQLLKFSVVLVLVIAAALMVGRIVLL